MVAIQVSKLKPRKLSFQWRKLCIKIPPVEKVMPFLVKPRRLDPTGMMPNFNQSYLPHPDLVLRDS